MSEETLDNVPQETQGTIPADNQPAGENTQAEDKFPEFKETSEKSVLRQQIEHAAKVEEKKRGNPYKSADGKFTKKPLEPKEAPETAASEAKPESEAKPIAEQQSQTVAMPKAWSADKQELWTSLPQAAKDFILSRENQVNEGFAKYQGIEPKYKELDAVLSPLDPMIQGYGTTRAQFVNQLTQWHQALANNPNEAFPALARAYGYNIGSPAAESAQQPLSDPRVDQLAPVVNQLQQKLADAERREQEAQLRQTSEQVASWAKDKPHYEAVRKQMGLLIRAAAESEQEMGLDEAYERAIWANPEIRNQLMKTQFEAEQKKAAEEAKKAKLASVSATTRPAPGTSNGAGKSTVLRDQILEAKRLVESAGRA